VIDDLIRDRNLLQMPTAMPVLTARLATDGRRRLFGAGLEKPI